MEPTVISTTYIATGAVLGNLWGGGKGMYPSEKILNTTEKQTEKNIIKLAETKLENGTLDSGMGFEGLIGALIEIETIQTIEWNEKQYKSYEYEFFFIGKLTKNEEKELVNYFQNLY